MAPIEYLQQFANADIKDEKQHIDYNEYMYREKVEDIMKDKLGVNTNSQTKSLMVGCLVQAINENSKCIKSQDLIDQFSGIERTYSGSIKSTGYSDLFMASCFCALVRNKKAIDILPLIEAKSTTVQGKKFVENYSEILDILGERKGSSIKHVDYSNEEVLYSSNIESLFGDSFEEDEQDFIPFFTQ